jgi:hypothetical protein
MGGLGAEFAGGRNFDELEVSGSERCGESRIAIGKEY